MRARRKRLSGSPFLDLSRLLALLLARYNSSFTDDMAPSTTALLDAFLSTTLHAIVPLTAKGVAAGCKVFGAA